jgi:hypothetical protein
VSPVDRPAPPSFALSASLFLRLLAVIHAVAFVSFWVQLDGLVGPNGLLPATRTFAAVREQLGSTGAAFAVWPSLGWFFGTDTFLHVLCASGVALSGLVFAGVAPALALLLLWASYLSLNYAGQIFFNFQWDTLLLETTLIAVFIAPWRWLPLWRAHEPPRYARHLLGWLLFRLMFMAGVVKLASGDPTWRDLSALTFHYETQPLPTVLGWFAHQLPAFIHRAACAGMFVIELVVPFFLFGPRGLRHNAAFLLIALMVGVALTGNYTFFNLLAIALCGLSFDDAALRRFAFWRSNAGHSGASAQDAGTAARPAHRFQRAAAAGFAAFAFLFTAAQTLPQFGLRPSVPGLATISAALAPYRSFNNYGLFAVITNPRLELVFEGSADGRTWVPYEFPHKPGALERRPTWVAPHQPRLDWQLWFAALGSLEQNRWVLAVCEHLLRGSPPVLALLKHNPFSDGAPRYVRVVRYEYHFTSAAERAATGQWWKRTPRDFYVPSASLR